MRMRISPDGPFVEAVGSTQGALPVGPGTSGIVYHAQGGGANTVLTGAGVPVLLPWISPVDGAIVTTLPWFLQKDLFWEFMLDLWLLESVAAPGGNVVVDISARDTVTSVRSSLFNQTVGPVPASNDVWSERVYGVVSAVGWANARDDVQVTLDGVVTLTAVATQTVLVATQFVP